MGLDRSLPRGSALSQGLRIVALSGLSEAGSRSLGNPLRSLLTTPDFLYSLLRLSMAVTPKSISTCLNVSIPRFSFLSVQGRGGLVLFPIGPLTACHVPGLICLYMFLFVLIFSKFSIFFK